MLWRSWVAAGVLLILFGSTAFAAGMAQTRPAVTTKQKVLCQPPEPRSNQPVEISFYPDNKTDSALIQYQVVDPGKYIPYTDKAYQSNWQSLPMTPSGDHFTVTLPPELQLHRRLVRYRFNIAGQIVPEKKGLPGNFAYFCFDGIGSWKGAIDPGSSNKEKSKVVEYDAKVMNSIQPLILIANKKDVEDSTWNLKDTSGKEWAGTIVYNHKVYDHVTYRARGGVWRYGMGKNMWRIDFDKDNPITLLDDFGMPMKVPVDHINLGACIQQAPRLRGEHGLVEAVSFKLFNLAGVPAPNTTWLQYRIIDAPEEHGKTQYDGDIWGLYLALENPDENFIKQHDIPSGNLYKMDRGSGPGGGELKAHAPNLPADNSDLVAFTKLLTPAKQQRSLLSAILSGSNTASNTTNSSQYFRDNLNLQNYYSFRSIIEAVHHYDLSDGKNYYYFHDSKTNRWSVFPWDTDQTWCDDAWGDGEEPLNTLLLDKPEFALEYHNRLREIRDLLFNPDETARLIDNCAALIHTPNQPNFIDVDRALWDYNPVLYDSRRNSSNVSGPGLFYGRAASPGDFPGMVNLMKNYIKSRGRWIDSTLLSREVPPKTPVIQSAGPANTSSSTLQFSCTPFFSASTAKFAAIQWRIAIVDSKPPSAKSPTHNWEIQPLWQSAELKDFSESFQFPDLKLSSGVTYRVRARMKDSDGVWSHWSDPVQWTLK